MNKKENKIKFLTKKIDFLDQPIPVYLDEKTSHSSGASQFFSIFSIALLFFLVIYGYIDYGINFNIRYNLLTSEIKSSNDNFQLKINCNYTPIIIKNYFRLSNGTIIDDFSYEVYLITNFNYTYNVSRALDSDQT